MKKIILFVLLLFVFVSLRTYAVETDKKTTTSSAPSVPKGLRISGGSSSSAPSTPQNVRVVETANPNQPKPPTPKTVGYTYTPQTYEASPYSPPEVTPEVPRQACRDFEDYKNAAREMQAIEHGGDDMCPPGYMCNAGVVGGLCLYRCAKTGATEIFADETERCRWTPCNASSCLFGG